MKRAYLLILTLMLGFAFISCKAKHDNDVPIDNYESIENDEKDLEGNEALNDGTEHIDISNEQVKDHPNETEAAVNYYVIGDGVRLREEASLESNILDLLNKGTAVEYVGTEGDWIKVKHDSKIGYIRNDLLGEEWQADEVVNSIVDIDNPKVIVKKADRILQLWDGDTLVESYPIGLGFDPVGDKQREGDGRTPEGLYYVCTRNSASRFYLSLGLSYPNIEDAIEGLEAGLIEQSTYDLIEDAITRKEQPPWNTALGGEIMIHGHGSHSDWTAGCIAVDDDIMDILWEHCRMGTTVIIEP